MPNMEIEVAREIGLCFGIRRAIKLLTEAASEHGKVEILGPVAHNQRLVQQLHKAGVNMIASLEETTGKVVAIPTHGVSLDTVSQMEAHKLHIIDATCPIVKRAQLAAAELAQADFTIIIFGEEEHSEVKGLLGWAQGKGMAALSVKQIITATQGNVIASKAKQSLLSSRLGVISQTTQSKASFTGFTSQLVTTFMPKTTEIRIINTLCHAIQARLETATKLARKSQLIIVIGGHNSANTKRLAEACSSIVETHLVETAEEIAQSWLDGKHRIGITAGASTPDEAIQEVIAKLNSLA
ncbi:MAG: 4-hydroxy-3-methylbut-2-enyl diphosphate reductase [Dehalococcoidales bacterium]|nr:4-hydroxy-3-methylbut-2-enyl diphosphate reductase [Dehalococcoidales bacterium]